MICFQNILIELALLICLVPIAIRTKEEKYLPAKFQITFGMDQASVVVNIRPSLGTRNTALAHKKTSML